MTQMKKFSCLLIMLGGILITGRAECSRPNVMVIVTDDQGYGDMSCHGNPWLETPHLDRLHREGVRLEDYHVDPVCTPTRAALMTGRYCARVGAWAVTTGRQLLNPDEVTMADVFAASGYRTGMFGKWHLGDPYPFGPRYRGFQDVVCHRAGGVDEIGNPKGNNYFDDTYFRNGVAEKFEGYCTDVFFNEAMRFMRDEDERPFFIYLPLNAMHSPVTVAERYWKPFAAQEIAEKRAKFFGMIQNFDENLGRLLTLLDEKDLSEETIVLFMGDNGTSNGANGIPAEEDGHNVGMRGKKGSVYDGGHRMACFVRWPGKLTAGREVEALTSHRDWLPTLIDLCSLKAPEGVEFDGSNITPLLKGDGEIPERTFFVERQGAKLKKGKLTKKGSIPFAVLTEKWRMVSGELYDIEEDPGQEKNVAEEYPEIVKALYDAYEEYFADVSSHDSAYTRFLLGAEKEKILEITVRDWFPTKGTIIWEKPQLGDDDLVINGYWAVDVVRAGRYQITLSRYPHDDLKPMGAKSARLEIGGQTLEKKFNEDSLQVTFDAELAAGPSLLKTWLKSGDIERGAYYVRISALLP